MKETFDLLITKGFTECHLEITISQYFSKDLLTLKEKLYAMQEMKHRRGVGVQLIYEVVHIS